MKKEDYLTPQEFAKSQDVDLATVYRWMNDRRLGFIKGRVNGGRKMRLIPRAVAEEFERKRQGVEVVES